MGGGISRPVTEYKKPTAEASKPVVPAAATTPPQPESSPNTVDVEHKPTSSIDARIVQTLSLLNHTRRQVNGKVKPMNFERIALRFGMARDAFETIHCIYYQFAGDDGLTFDGLKAALNALGAHMNESDMREIFYESDMVRDNTLSHNEFVVSLAIAFLLGSITNFECIKALPTDETASDSNSNHSHRNSVSGLSARDDAPAIVGKTLELVVTAYLMFDEDASGTIQTNEVRKIMQKHETSNHRMLERTSSGMTTKAIRAERIKEMDVNEDGTITFQEFVLTFQKWVGIDEGEPDENA